MKQTLIVAAAAVAAGLAAAYLTGADGTNSVMPQSGTQTQKPTNSIQQIMQAPALETEGCSEGLYCTPLRDVLY